VTSGYASELAVVRQYWGMPLGKRDLCLGPLNSKQFLFNSLLISSKSSLCLMTLSKGAINRLSKQYGMFTRIVILVTLVKLQSKIIKEVNQQHSCCSTCPSKSLDPTQPGPQQLSHSFYCYSS
jgi:hypothetical protein